LDVKVFHLEQIMVLKVYVVDVLKLALRLKQLAQVVDQLLLGQLHEL